MKLGNIDGKLLERAIEIYFQFAYYDQAIPTRARALSKWSNPDDQEGPIWGDARFETAHGAHGRRFYLRLGNRYYPHMKLGIVECAGQPGEFVFEADTHDRHFELDSNLPDLSMFREVMRKNEVLKCEIESSWMNAGIPTSSAHFTGGLQSNTLQPLSHKSLTILIVDDTPGTLTLERVILEKKGYNVIACDNGMGVIETVKRYPVDACVLDIMMPGMDGYEVVRMLELSGQRTFPIAFASAMIQERVKYELADAYIQKPFSGVYFLEKVQELLSLKKRETTPVH